jgi:hypothetical protein
LSQIIFSIKQKCAIVKHFYSFWIDAPRRCAEKTWATVTQTSVRCFAQRAAIFVTFPPERKKPEKSVTSATLNP